jgi:hypothetical protein
MMTDSELITRLEHFSGLSYGNPLCKDASERIQDLKVDNARMAHTLRMISNNLPRYNWKETTSLPDRLRAIAWMMNAGAAWGFVGESLFLEQAADLLENKNV